MRGGLIFDQMADITQLGVSDQEPERGIATSWFVVRPMCRRSWRDQDPSRWATWFLEILKTFSAMLLADWKLPMMQRNCCSTLFFPNLPLSSSLTCINSILNWDAKYPIFPNLPLSSFLTCINSISNWDAKWSALHYRSVVELFPVLHLWQLKFILTGMLPVLWLGLLRLIWLGPLFCNSWQIGLSLSLSGLPCRECFQFLFWKIPVGTLCSDAFLFPSKDSKKQQEAWNLGTIIILSIAKSSPSSVEGLVKLLTEQILTLGKVGASSIHYTTCLSQLICHRRSVIMEQPNVVFSLLDDIASFDISTARNVLMNWLRIECQTYAKPERGPNTTTRALFKN